MFTPQVVAPLGVPMTDAWNIGEELSWLIPDAQVSPSVTVVKCAEIIRLEPTLHSFLYAGVMAAIFYAAKPVSLKLLRGRVEISWHMVPMSFDRERPPGVWVQP